MTIDRAATAWTPHPGGPLRYRANSRFGADGLPPGAWFGRVSAAIEAPDGSVVVFQRGPAIDPIVFLDRDGTYLRSWDLGFDLPHGMRLMTDGTLWLTDAGRHRVLKTTLDGEILMELGTADVAGTDERTFNKPTDVAVAADGTIYVSDGYGNCRVVIFDPDGTYRGTWGVPGTAPGEFDTPHSVAVAPDGSIWVSDRGNLRIQRFERDGRYIDAWTHLGATQCIEFYEDELWIISHRSIGELLGWDSLGGRLMKVDPASGDVLGSIPLAGHFFHRAPSGDIWVGALNGTVVRLTSDWSDLAGEMEPAPVTFKVGAQILTYGSTWDEALDVVRSLDEMGYSYIWGHDHLYSTGGDPYQGFFEGWTTLSAWAQATTRARLGLLVGANTFRNPGVVAKMAVTIDHASHGRSILGLGAGNVAFENIAHGIDPGKTMGQRMDWFEESLAMVVALLAGEEVTHHSEKYQFEKVRHAPRPLQARIPVVIGADGEKRGLKLAARYADIWQWFAPFDGVATFRHKDEVLRAHADAEGRDASTIERMLGAKLILRSDPDEAQRVAEELVAIHKWGPSVWDAVWATTPERAADRLVEFVEAGAHSFSPQIGWPYDRETIERLIGEVVPAVEARVEAGTVPEG